MRVATRSLRPQLFTTVAELAVRAGCQLIDVAGDLSAPDLVLVDSRAPSEELASLSEAGVPRYVLCLPGEVDVARTCAAAIRASHVLVLPEASEWLAAQLSTSRRVLAIAGVVGGAGATTLAIACALAVPDPLLVDADPATAGAMALALGIEPRNGASLQEVPLTSSGIDGGSLRSALPRVAGMTVAIQSLAPGSAGVQHELDQLGVRVAALVRTAERDFGAAIVDLGRAGPSLRVPERATLILVAPASTLGTQAIVRLLPLLVHQDPQVAFRGTSYVSATEAAERVSAAGQELRTIALPHLRRAGERADAGDLIHGRSARSLTRLGQRVWEQVDA